MKIFKEVFIANIKELIRDKSGMFWLIAFPIIFVFIFGLIFTGGSGEQSYTIGLVFEGDSPVNETIERSIRNVPVFNLSTNTRNEEIEALNSGRRELVMIVPEIDTDNIQEYNIEIFYNNERSGSASILISSLKEVFFNIERELTNREEFFNIISKPVQTERLSDFDYILPGILAMAIMQLGLFGSFQFLNLREKKIIRGLGVTPLPRHIILSSEILMRLLISLMQTVLIIFIGRWLFDVQIVSNLFKVFGIVLIGAFAFISLGYMLITFANSMESGRGIVQVVQFPMLFLSGIFFPIEFMPSYVRPVVKILPLTYLGNALREAMVGIPSGVAMSRNLLILAVWSVVTLIITIKFWKWE
jgi:ABC-2 type transport system permease protein